MTKQDYWARRASLFAAAALLVAASPALADSDKSEKGKSHGAQKEWSEPYERYEHQERERHEERYEERHEDGMTTIRIGDDDRNVLRGYLDEGYHKNCPPGLAKKHNGCLPPGIAKKRYEVGHPLDGSVSYEDVPDYILKRLRPVPDGYKYVKVDTDVLLIGEASKKVIDAVTLLSGVGRQ